jgi:Bacterial low temperature requirement A protein (LtrA)
MTRPRFLQIYVSDNEMNGDRHATWLALFFDLVFVVAIAELAHALHDHQDGAGMINFAISFIPVWWLWIDFSYYADQFDVERGVYRLIMFCVMFGMIVLALSVPEALQEGSAQFAAVYSALRLIIVGLYFQAWRLVPESRELTQRYTLSFAVSLILWVVSIALPPPVRFMLWGIALLIEISNGLITYATIRSGRGDRVGRADWGGAVFRPCSADGRFNDRPHRVSLDRVAKVIFCLHQRLFAGSPKKTRLRTFPISAYCRLSLFIFLGFFSFQRLQYRLCLFWRYSLLQCSRTMPWTVTAQRLSL